MTTVKKYLFIGLGNPGPEFTGTRHNLGIDVLRAWVAQVSPTATWRQEHSFFAEIVDFTVAETAVTGLFPLTYMNESGRAVRAYQHYYEVPAEQLLIIHDDIELPLGAVALEAGGSARGHKGVRSIQETLGTQTIARLRLGVGRPADRPVDQYVLERFVADEREAVASLTLQACAKLSEIVSKSN